MEKQVFKANFHNCIKCGWEAMIAEDQNGVCTVCLFEAKGQDCTRFRIIQRERLKKALELDAEIKAHLHEREPLCW